MDEKLTLQELIELLARRHDMEKEDADAFVRMFFKLIEEALETDKYVKIKGLGTFKLIEIQGGSRISFTPDTTMRELVNKPFSHFETVVLNDNTHFDDIREEENVSVLSSEIEEALEEGEISETDKTLPAEEEPSSSPENMETPADVESKEQDIFPEPEPMNSFEEATPLEIPGTSPEEASSSVPLTTSSRRKVSGFPWCMLASILLVGVFVGGGMVWNFFSNKRYVSDTLLDSLIYQRLNKTVLIEQTSERKDTSRTLEIPPSLSESAEKRQVLKHDTVQPPETVIHSKPVDDAAQVSSSSVSKKQNAAPEAKKETLSDTVEYQITGTQTTYTLRSGESLVKVAQKFYGNKRLWPYLVKHNKKVIKNADRIPAGITIEIPTLTPKRK